MATFSTINKSGARIPAIPFKAIKEYVLGKKYELSVAFLSQSEARRVTRTAKHKDKASNMLAFPLSKNSGELLLCPETARAQAPRYHKSARAFLGFLFIHGLLHLEGYRHGATMEHEEARIAKRFGL